VSVRPGRPNAHIGVARTIAPAAPRNDNGKVTAWRAQYRDAQNRKRQLGVFRTQAAARRASEDYVAELNTGRQPISGLTLSDWMELWPARVGRDPRTVATHRTRIEAYVYPYLPGAKNQAIAEIVCELLARRYDELGTMPNAAAAQWLPAPGERGCHMAPRSCAADVVGPDHERWPYNSWPTGEVGDVDPGPEGMWARGEHP
jgi:hypothetical protein